MSLKLYFAPGACSFVPHSMLELSGAEFEPHGVKLHKNEQRSPEYLAINPRGQVPVLVDDGQVITQIVAILLHLDAKLPEAGILPPAGQARTRALQTLTWMNNTVHPTFTHVFMPFKFASTPESQAEIKAHGAQLYAPMLAEIEAMAAAAAARGRAYLGGDKFGPLDAYALTLLRWGGFAGIDPATLPALWTHVQKVAALPAVARAIERERLQLNVYKPA